MAFCYFPNHLFTGHNLITVYTSGENSVPSTYKFFSIALNKRITKVVTDFILKHQLVKSSKKKKKISFKVNWFLTLYYASGSRMLQSQGHKQENTATVYVINSMKILIPQNLLMHLTSHQ